MAHHLTPDQRWFIVKRRTEGQTWAQIVTQWQATYPNRNCPTKRSMLKLMTKMDQYQTLQDNRKGRCGRKKKARIPFVIQWVFTIITGDMLAVPGDPVNTARRNAAGVTKSTWNRKTKTDLKMHPFIIVKRQTLTSSNRMAPPAILPEWLWQTWTGDQ